MTERSASTSIGWSSLPSAIVAGHDYARSRCSFGFDSPGPGVSSVDFISSPLIGCRA